MGAFLFSKETTMQHKELARHLSVNPIETVYTVTMETRALRHCQTYGQRSPRAFMWSWSGSSFIYRDIIFPIQVNWRELDSEQKKVPHSLFIAAPYFPFFSDTASAALMTLGVSSAPR